VGVFSEHSVIGLPRLPERDV